VRWSNASGNPHVSDGTVDVRGMAVSIRARGGAIDLVGQTSPRFPVRTPEAFLELTTAAVNKQRLPFFLASHPRALRAMAASFRVSSTIALASYAAVPYFPIHAYKWIAPDGTETLVARGLYRPDINSGPAPTHQVFQLHADGWKFAAGHVAKLELLPSDAPYGRVSNGQLPITVSNLELRLPVLEKPKGGTILTPAPKVVPPGYTLARDFKK
jgi:hypothetical protein